MLNAKPAHKLSMRHIMILGSPDPEMAAIETLARDVGYTILYAAIINKDGKPQRVTPGSLPTGVLDATGYTKGPPPSSWTEAAVVLVEIPRQSTLSQHIDWADMSTGQHAYGAIYLDHHAPHPASDLPPDEYMGGSLGQFVSLLARRGQIPESWSRGAGPGLDVGDIGYPVYATCFDEDWTEDEAADNFLTSDVVVGLGNGMCAVVPPVLCALAAADHCLAAAYSGRCPGADLRGPRFDVVHDAEGKLVAVARDASAGYLADLEGTRASLYPDMSPEDFTMAIEEARRTLLEAGTVSLGQSDIDIADLRVDPDKMWWGLPSINGERYPIDFVAGPRVSAIEGRPFITYIVAKHGLALRVGGLEGEQAATFERLWMREGLAVELGCLPPDAPGPTNAYASPRGFAGGTMRDQPSIVAEFQAIDKLLSQVRAERPDATINPPAFCQQGKQHDYAGVLEQTVAWLGARDLLPKDWPRIDDFYGGCGPGTVTSTEVGVPTRPGEKCDGGQIFCRFPDELGELMKQARELARTS